MGAGRIAVHHTKTMQLIRDLQLEKDLIYLDSNVAKSLEPLEHFASEEDALIFLSKIAKTALHKIPKKYLTAMNFHRVCKIFFRKKYKKIREAAHVSGYDTEFQVGNGLIMCHTILDLYKPD